MALRLDDLGKPARKKGFSATQWLDQSIAESQEQKKTERPPAKTTVQQKLRPWENYDEVELSTRTYAAQEALLKARRIREKNEDLARSMREGHVSQDVEKKLSEEQLTREQAFNFSETQMNSREAKIKTAPSWLSFVRDLLKH